MRAESLPAGRPARAVARVRARSHGVDAMFQVGYHARGGVDGFLSHTYVPGLRLRLDDELISESHWRAWAVGAPLLGIVGNDRHLETLGSLAADAVPRRAALARARRDVARLRRSGRQASTRSAALRSDVRGTRGRRRRLRCGKERRSRPACPNGDAVGETMAGWWLDAGRRRRVRGRARDLGGGTRSARCRDGCGARALRSLLARQLRHRRGCGRRRSGAGRGGAARSSTPGAPSPSRSGTARPPIRCRKGSAETDAFTPSYLMS